MKVSVIVPIYNVEKYIARCADSLFNQTLDEIEYIFINDCSPDDSLKVLQNVIESFPERKPFITIINNDKNEGPGYSRQKGLSFARGKFIVCCDSDDWIDVDMYKNMYDKAQETNSDIVFCDIIYHYTNETLCEKLNIKEDTNIECIIKKCIEERRFSFHNKLIRKSLFSYEDVYSDSKYIGEDMITIKLLYYAQKVTYIPKAYYHYNRTNNSSIIKTVDKHYNEVIKAINGLDNFFLSKCNYDVFKKSIIFFKLKIKINILHTITSKEKLVEWGKIFPECNKYIWDVYYKINLFSKILYTLAIKDLGIFIILKVRLSKLISI